MDGRETLEREGGGGIGEQDLKFGRRRCDLPGVLGEREDVRQMGRCGAAGAAGGGTDLGARRPGRDDGLRLALLSPFSSFEFGRAGEEMANSPRWPDPEGRE